MPVEEQNEQKQNPEEQQGTQGQAQAESEKGATSTETETPKEKIPYDRFKEKVDEVNELKAEIEAFKQKQQAEETEKLKEQNEYKTLYEKALQTIETQKTEAIEAKKKSLLTQAGYTEEQVAILSQNVTGDSDEALEKSVEVLKQVVPPKQQYVDPPLGNTERDKPTPTDKDEIGKKVFERIKGKIF